MNNDTFVFDCLQACIVLLSLIQIALGFLSDAPLHIERHFEYVHSRRVEPNEDEQHHLVVSKELKCATDERILLRESLVKNVTQKMDQEISL